MKILYIHNSKINDGFANVIQVTSMCKALVKSGFDVTLSVPSTNVERDYDLYSSLHEFKLHFREQSFFNSRFEKYFEYFNIRKTIRKFSPDILYIRHSVVLRHSLGSNIPIIFEIHNDRLHHGSNILNHYLMSTIIKSVDNGKILKIVSISEALKQALINYGFNGSRIIVAHDGFDPEKFHEIIDTKDARIALKLPLDSKIITYTGSLYKDRKIENIIRLAERFQDALFVVVGGPNDQCEYYRRVAQSRGLKNVHLTGQVKHSTVPFYLQASDILLALWSSEVPTINYCSPLKIFEYMASGKLILAHGFETIKEVLSDGVNAVIVEPDSFEDLCDKLDYILTNDDLQHLGDNARKIAFEKYSWDIRCGYIFKNIY